MAACTANAVATPAHTHEGRNRVPSTSEANIDLSGSSARNESAKATPITATYCTGTSSVRTPPGSETSAGCAQQPKVSSTTSPWPGGRARTRRYVGQPARDYSPSPSDNKQARVLLPDAGMALITLGVGSLVVDAAIGFGEGTAGAAPAQLDELGRYGDRRL